MIIRPYKNPWWIERRNPAFYETINLCVRLKFYSSKYARYPCGLCRETVLERLKRGPCLIPDQYLTDIIIRGFR